MSMEHTGSSMGGGAAGTGSMNSQGSLTESEGLMFAPNPVWERNRKRRLGGGRKTESSVPASAPAAAMAGTEGMAPPMNSADAAMTARHTEHATPMSALHQSETERHDHHDADGLVAPIGRARTTRTTTRKGGMPAAALGAGLLTLAAVGAVGWYATQGDDGVAELTPGSTAATVAAATPMAPDGSEMAANTAAPPAAAPTTTTTRTASVSSPARAERTTTTRTASVSRARPAETAPSATEAGISASGVATLPAGPQPYSAVSSGADASATTGATVTPAPAPAPSATTTPAPMPTTPPVTEGPAPDASASPATTPTPETSAEPTP